MWQSRVEIEDYSVDSSAIHASTKRVYAPPLMEVQRYGALNAVMQLKYAT